MVADIAYQRLSKNTQDIISNILFPMPNHGDDDNDDGDNSNRKQDGYDKSKYASPMSAVATWADRMRYTKEFAWTEPLHFVDIRDDLIPGTIYNLQILYIIVTCYEQMTFVLI